jgi:BolA protein
LQAARPRPRWICACASSNGTGSGTHFRVRIASPQFTGKSRVQRHRLVYDALQDFMDQGLHALAIEVL